MTSMSHDYPVIFQLTNEIWCDRFTARVISQGRALMAFEDGEWWCHGVEPGGMTEHGETPPRAFSSFRMAYQQVLEDLAGDCRDFNGFQAAVNAFVNDTDHDEERKWLAARAQIRAGKPVQAPFDGLPRVTKEPLASVQVDQVEQFVCMADNLGLAQAA